MSGEARSIGSRWYFEGQWLRARSVPVAGVH